MTASTESALATTLNNHLAGRHAAVCAPDASLDELVELHEHEHNGPCGIRNHPIDDLTYDPAQVELVRSGAGWDGTNGAMIVCDMCYPDAVGAGNITPGLAVVCVDGVWRLMMEPAHRDDEYVVFADPPRPDPLGDGILDEIDAAGEDGENDPRLNVDPTWDVDAMAAMADAKPLTLSAAAELYNDMRVVGYNPERDGYAELWLYHQAGKLIAAHTNTAAVS